MFGAGEGDAVGVWGVGEFAEEQAVGVDGAGALIVVKIGLGQAAQ